MDKLRVNNNLEPKIISLLKTNSVSSNNPWEIDFPLDKIWLEEVEEDRENLKPSSTIRYKPWIMTSISVSAVPSQISKSEPKSSYLVSRLLVAQLQQATLPSIVI
jgi:hypothetical protein